MYDQPTKATTAGVLDVFRNFVKLTGNEKNRTEACNFIKIETFLQCSRPDFLAAVQRCSVKNVFLEILQNSQKTTCARALFLIKLQVYGPSFIDGVQLPQR